MMERTEPFRRARTLLLMLAVLLVASGSRWAGVEEGVQQEVGR